MFLNEGYLLYNVIRIPNIITIVPGRKVLAIIRNMPNPIIHRLPINKIFMNFSGSQNVYHKVPLNW